MHFISFKRPRSANIRSWRVSEEEENIDNQKTQNKIHQKKMKHEENVRRKAEERADRFGLKKKAKRGKKGERKGTDQDQTRAGEQHPEDQDAHTPEDHDSSVASAPAPWNSGTRRSMYEVPEEEEFIESLSDAGASAVEAPEEETWPQHSTEE